MGRWMAGWVNKTTDRYMKRQIEYLDRKESIKWSYIEIVLPDREIIGVIILHRWGGNKVFWSFLWLSDVVNVRKELTNGKKRFLSKWLLRENKEQEFFIMNIFQSIKRKKNQNLMFVLNEVGLASGAMQREVWNMRDCSGIFSNKTENHHSG